MHEKAKVQFYKVEQCGFYKAGKATPEFGGLVDIFSDLAQWVVADNKTLEETCTFTPKDPDSTLRTFCYDIAHNTTTGDYLITVWNESHSNAGKMVSVDGSGKVGDADVNFQDIPKGSIPGYSTYFWILPTKNVIASVRFQHNRMVGKESLEKYIKSFSACFSSFVVYEEAEDDDKQEIVGYRDKQKDDPKKLYPRFSAHPIKKAGEIDYIKGNADEIVKIISKNELSPTIPIDRTLFQKMLQKLSPNIQRETINPEIEIKYEVPFSPTEEELEDIIAQWKTSQNESRWEDVGFKMTGDGKTYWLSHTMAKDEIDIDVERKDDEIVFASSILEELTQKRRNLLRLLN